MRKIDRATQLAAAGMREPRSERLNRFADTVHELHVWVEIGDQMLDLRELRIVALENDERVLGAHPAP